MPLWRRRGGKGGGGGGGEGIDVRGPGLQADLANDMERFGGAALEARTGVLQDHEHGQHDGVRLFMVLLLDAADDESISILDARVPQHFALGGVSLDESETAWAHTLFLGKTL